MKIAERIIGGLAVLGFILKLLDIPGGSTLLILSIGALSLFYFAGSYFLFAGSTSVGNPGVSTEKASAARILGSIATGMSLSTALIGILFIMMQWPGGAAQLIIGLASIFIIGILSITKYLQHKSALYKRIIIRIVVVGLIGILVYFL